VHWRAQSRSLLFSVLLLGGGCARGHSGSGVLWGMGGGRRGRLVGLISGLAGGFDGLVGIEPRRCRNHADRLIY
jgi:hypothetical protein